jgi:ribosomal protein L32E
MEKLKQLSSLECIRVSKLSMKKRLEIVNAREELMLKVSGASLKL